MATGTEIYERLQPLLGDDVARDMARMAEMSSEFVTNTVFRTEMANFRAEIRSEFREFRHEFQLQLAEFKADTRDWMLKFFIPLWIGVYGTLVAVAISIVVRR